MTDHKEQREKLARVRAYLKTHGLDGVVLAGKGNFAWLTAGGDNHVVSQSDAGFGALYVTARSTTLIADTIEGPRISSEEPVTDFPLKTYPWTLGLPGGVNKILGAKAKNVAADDATLGLKPLPGDFDAEVRAELLPHEIKRYQQLGRDCSLVTETVARQLNPGDSGHQVEADLARHLLARGIQPFVLLVAFDSRLLKYRHPTPTANHLRHHAMLVVCGQRGGLIASLTRLVHFGPVPAEILAKHESVLKVEAAMWQATVPGTSYGDALKAGIAQYKKEGFAKEWELHHQGGPTGYAGRDYLVTPDEKRVVQPNQAVAWNPSITGTKTEDTFVVDAEGQRTVLTTCSQQWPTISFTHAGEEFVRPGILVR